MNILIIGAQGMLGTDLMEIFCPVHDVLGFDLPGIDITSLDQCLSLTERCRPQVIINAAAFTRVDDCETFPEKAFAVNGAGAGNLASAAMKQNALLVHFSTDYVFNGLKREPYIEEDAPDPQSVYGKSKLRGEDLIRTNCPNHMILRTSWPFGRNGPNFLRTILGAAMAGMELRVVQDQQGSPTYSKDLASQTLRMVEAGCRGTYHVTNSGSCTWFDLAQNALKWAGLQRIPVAPVATSEFPRPAKRPANSILANARLEREKLPQMRSWQEAGREYVQQNLKQKS